MRPFSLVLSTLSFLASLTFVILLFIPLAIKYLNLPEPTGGDYYNALTYAVNFAKHLPFPPAGWLNFWHQGIPIIGGYPTFIFYLMSPLFKVMGGAQAMEIFSIAGIGAFVTLSFILFWIITKSGPVSAFLALIIFATRATYYQLFAEGQVVASASQWLAPLTFIFIYLHNTQENKRFIVLAAISSGFALLFHPAISFLTVIIPGTLMLLYNFLVKKQGIASITKHLVFFGGIIVGIGCTGLYSTYLQIFKGAGSGACNSPQCWGLYPDHLVLWFDKITVFIVSGLLIAAILTKLIYGKKVLTAHLIGSILAYLTLLLYPLASYLRLIDTFASAIFPRRIFWAINLLALIIAAHSYKILKVRLSRKFSFLLPAVTLLVFAGFLYSNPKFLSSDKLIFSVRPGVIPYPIPTNLPEWVVGYARNVNFRFDSFNNQVTHWWNSAFDMPATRGYSNSPVGTSADWLYYLQVATGENHPQKSSELVANRTLFLIDHFGIALYDDSGRASTGGLLGYDRTILASKEIAKSERVRELSFFEISDKITSPIVFPTTSSPVLFVGGSEEYKNFIKVLAMVNLNSQILIPVKGPESIDNIDSKEMEIFKTLIVYRAEGKNWNKIGQFLEKGGSVFIETAGKIDLPQDLKEKVPVSETNLFYNIVKNDDFGEAKKFKNIINKLVQKSSVKSSFKVERPTPESITVTGKDFTGIYFKENYHPGWKATARLKTIGYRLQTYKAGPEFMYIPVPRGTDKVEISFRGSFTTWSLFLLTIFSISVSLLYLIFPHPFHHSHKKIKTKISRWFWEEE